MDTLSELFSFQGRANRAWYILHTVIDDAVILAIVLAMIVMGFVVGIPILILPLAGVLIGGVVAATAVSVKRLHDLGMSGWNVLGMCVPFYNIYLGFKMFLVRGTLGPNRYGPDPLMPNQLIEDGNYDVYQVEGR